MKLQDYIIYKSIFIFLKLIGSIPRKYAVQISNFIGNLWFLLDKNHRNTALKNLNYAFGKEFSKYKIRSIAKKSFANLVLMQFEIGLILRLKLKDRDKYFDIKGVSNLKKAHEKKRGILLLSGHLGNWEIASIVLNSLEIPPCTVYKKIESEPIDKAIYDIRTRFGGTFFPMRSGAMKKIFNLLQKNYMLYLLIDQNSPRDVKQSIFIDFFEKKASAMTGPAKIALLSGASIVPFFIFRDKGRFVAEFQPELEIIRTGDLTKDIEINTQRFNDIIEENIRRYPDQWFWVHKRWRTRPYKYLS